MMWIGYILLTIFFLASAFLTVMVWRVRSSTLGTRIYQVASGVNLPRHHKLNFQKPQDQLRKLGFRFHHYETINYQHLSTNIHTGWLCVFYHPKTQNYAIIAPPLTPYRIQAYTIAFTSFDAAGACISTVSGMAHAFVLGTPSWIINDPYTPDLVQQWQTHLNALGQYDFTSIYFDDKEFAQQLSARHQRYLDYLQNSGLVCKVSARSYQFKWPTALKFALKAISGEQKVAKKWKTVAEANIDEQARLDAETFEQLLETRKNRAYWPIKLLATIGALALAYIFVPEIWWSPRAIVALLLLIILHDMILLFGARRTGWQRPSDFYFTWLSKEYVEETSSTNPVTESVWLLSAALPGLFISYGYIYIASVSAKPTAIAIASLGFLISLLNLAPAPPFTGSRLLNSLCFDHYPRSQAIFWGALIFALIYLVTWVVNKPSLFMLTLLIIPIFILALWYFVILLIKVRQSLPSIETLPRRVITTAIFRVLLTSFYRRNSVRANYTIAKQLLERSQPRPVATLPAYAILVSYLLAISLPLIFLSGNI